MAITIAVSKVERARQPLSGPVSEPVKLLGRAVEARGSSALAVAPASGHPLLEAVGTAFAQHYPLVLTPDAIWLAIAQGFAQHVNANAEALRGKFVRHQGKVEIVVRRDDFRKGSSTNAWPEAFHLFSDAIAKHIGKQRDLVVCDFSTTGASERAASEIVLMDAMKHYVDYTVLTRCGIPEITLEGTAEDWRSIRQRAQVLEEYDLGWWVAGLAPVLDQLVAAATGHVDTAFWRSLFKRNQMSGGPYISGWINVLFPYLHDDEGPCRNEWVSNWADGEEAGWGGGMCQAEVLTGLSVVPFEWRYFSETFPMEFVGGFVGVAQDEGSLALRPAIGWAVRDAA
jgi:hypothetical protein